MFTELAPGVFSVAHRFVDGMNGLIIGSRAALAVDVGYYPDDGQAMADFIQSQGREPNRVVLTHGHSDHVLGGQAFTQAEVFAHARTPDEIHRQLMGFAQRKNLSYEELLDQALWPTVTFTGELVIDLGGKHVRLLPTPGHSVDHISCYLEEDRVLFAGDTVVTGIIPAIGDGSSEQLQASLYSLTRLEIDTVVPGHGPVIRGASQVHEWLAWMQEYLASVRAFVQLAYTNDPASDPNVVADGVSYEKFVGDRLPLDKHGMGQRHRNTVMKIIAEERDKLKQQS